MGRVRMPAVRQPALGIHSLDCDLDGHALMAGHRDHALDTRAGRERTLELDAEPGAELIGIGESAPDTRAGCAQNDLFLDPVCRVMQSHGCMLPRRRLKIQPMSCVVTMMLSI